MFQHGSALIDLPFMLFNEMRSQDEQKYHIDLYTSTIHSHKCYENNFTFKTTNKEEGIFNQCENLAFDTCLNKIIERSAQTETDHLNYKYLTTQQLIKTIEKKNETSNNDKMIHLNYRKQIVSLRNKQNDYKRLGKLLSENEIPGVCRLVKVCINSNREINGIINTVVSAIKGNFVTILYI